MSGGIGSVPARIPIPSYLGDSGCKVKPAIAGNFPDAILTSDRVPLSCRHAGRKGPVGAPAVDPPVDRSKGLRSWQRPAAHVGLLVAKRETIAAR